MSWDALVIGAGPAGSVSARELARRGCRVLLVDKATFPRAKVCGCCLNGAAVAALERLGLGHVLRDAVPVHRVTVAAGRRSANLSLPRGVALSRDVFDARLVDEAVKAGVEFRPSTMVNLESMRVASPKVGDLAPRVASSEMAGFWEGEAPVEPIHFGGSAGASLSQIRQSRGVTRGASDLRSQTRLTIVASGLTGGDATPEPGSRIGAGTMLPAEIAPAFFTPGTIYMATGHGGYVGLVRVEDGRLDVAAAFDAAFVKSAGGLGPAAETILCEVGWPVPPDLALQPWRGTPALTRRPARLGGNRFFVVGDAAGYVEPFTGEGMAWAVMSAAALAPLAACAVRDWDDRFVREWEALHRRVVGRRQRVCRVVSRVLRSPVLTRLAVGALGLLPILSRPVVTALNRPSLYPNAATA